MSSSTRTVTRLLRISTLRRTTRQPFSILARHAAPAKPDLEARTEHFHHDATPPTGTSSAQTRSNVRAGLQYGIGFAFLAAVLAGGWAHGRGVRWNIEAGSAGETSGLFTPTEADYQKVYNEIAEKLDADYDDGSFGPVLVRLAWHASGTYDRKTQTGGSNGATMRFAPEGDHGANAGLVAARNFLEPIKEQFPWISYSDLWILAGVCALQEMSGPTIPWRPGRRDRDLAACTPDGRLPDATKGSDHLRTIFGRMGFDDQEIVALSGAHALGRCHTDRSGFTGPWTFSPTMLTNDYYKLLVEEKWGWKKWTGPKQYEDKKTKTLMMLPTDMVLVQDKKFASYVKQYAQDNHLFFKDFSAAIVRLFELGVPFEETSGETKRFSFKPVNV